MLTLRCIGAGVAGAGLIAVLRNAIVSAVFQFFKKKKRRRSSSFSLSPCRTGRLIPQGYALKIQASIDFFAM
jgi:hypothetical protein